VNQLLRSKVTIVLLAANVGMFAWMWMHGVDALSPSIQDLGRFGANQGYAVAHGGWYRLIACMFLHGGLIHLCVNMWSLYVLGPVAEDLYGPATFFLVYMIAGLGGSIASSLWHPLVVSVGASGAIFGLLGAIVAFFLSHRKHMPGDVFRSFMQRIALVIGINLYLGFSVPQIDNSAHVGGMVTGFVCGLAAYSPPRTARKLTAPILSRLGVVVVALVGVTFLVPWRTNEALRELDQRGQPDETRPR
jgi:rhomboid protease GluP